MLIPKLFDAIRLGNVKSEYVLGDRIIGKRQVRLKLVAEVVDPGSNPLATHSQMRTVQTEPVAMDKPGSSYTPTRSEPRGPLADTPVTNRSATASDPSGSAASRRGPRRKHPMSRST